MWYVPVVMFSTPYTQYNPSKEQPLPASTHPTPQKFTSKGWKAWLLQLEVLAGHRLTFIYMYEQRVNSLM